MTTPEFRPWPKIARLNRDITITEKIDGTNACIIVTEDGDVFAQSRKRIITPESDNFGFAKWVAERADQARDLLGPGYHYGEWYGLGIQRGYGLKEKRFALFNTSRWALESDLADPDWKAKFDAAAARQEAGFGVVPIIYSGPLRWYDIDEALDTLRDFGSWVAAEDWNGEAEGIVIYHHAANISFKVTLRDDEAPKTAVTARQQANA